MYTVYIYMLNEVLYINYNALVISPFFCPGPAHGGLNSYSAQEGIKSKGNIVNMEYPNNIYIYIYIYNK